MLLVKPPSYNHAIVAYRCRSLPLAFLLLTPRRFQVGRALYSSQGVPWWYGAKVCPGDQKMSLDDELRQEMSENPLDAFFSHPFGCVFSHIIRDHTISIYDNLCHIMSIYFWYSWRRKAISSLLPEVLKLFTGFWNWLWVRWKGEICHIFLTPFCSVSGRFGSTATFVVRLLPQNLFTANGPTKVRFTLMFLHIVSEGLRACKCFRVQRTRNMNWIFQCP